MFKADMVFWDDYFCIGAKNWLCIKNINMFYADYRIRCFITSRYIIFYNLRASTKRRNKGDDSLRLG